MVSLHTLKPAVGSVKGEKRVGRGPGSGRGGTSTRGHKGAKSRSGYKSKRGFEGGQTPLQRRLPMFGFKNPNRVAYRPINIDLLQKLVTKHEVSVIDNEFLNAHGLTNKNSRYKILGNGEWKGKIEVVAHAFSASAVQAIEGGGGKVTLLN